jgi:hypothetical protein
VEEREWTRAVSQPRHEVPRFGVEAFKGQPSRTREAERPVRRSEDLHICPACASEMVYPVDWEPAAERRWTVDLRCPECEWTGGGTYTQKAVDRFDEILDTGSEAILDDLNVLARANMEDEVDAFATALRADQVLPEDF